MRRLGTRIGLAPVLGGFALALAIVALVVGQASAQTKCEQCQAYVTYKEGQKAGGKCYGLSGYSYITCVNTEIYYQCFATGKCPDGAAAPSMVTCAGYLDPDTDCGQNSTATGPCTNETWNVSCQDGAPDKKCKDTQLPPDGKVRPSACYVKCDCVSP